MEQVTAGEHKARLANLAALWQQARQDGGNLISEAEAKARALETATAADFAEAKLAAERDFLLVRHDIAEGFLRVFHLVEVEPAAMHAIENKPS